MTVPGLMSPVYKFMNRSIVKDNHRAKKWIHGIHKQLINYEWKTLQSAPCPSFKERHQNGSVLFNDNTRLSKGVGKRHFGVEIGNHSATGIKGPSEKSMFLRNCGSVPRTVIYHMPILLAMSSSSEKARHDKISHNKESIDCYQAHIKVHRRSVMQPIRMFELVYWPEKMSVIP